MATTTITVLDSKLSPLATYADLDVLTNGGDTDVTICKGATSGTKTVADAATFLTILKGASFTFNATTAGVYYLYEADKTKTTTVPSLIVL